ncbi:MAG: hypothetical protein OXT73_09450 [Bacteroidota bacterium]|nr:hypothetical protein [Bacteroidota bacterium]
MRRSLLVIAGLVLLTGCSPRLSPLYRDYEVRADSSSAPTVLPDDHSATMDAIRDGLEDAGWTLTDSVTDNVIATEARQFREWGVYAIEVELEAAPVGGKYVRLFVHPYRIYFTGAKRKIPYLRGSLARSVLKDLHASMDEQGLEFIGTAQTRDRAILQRD